MFVTSPKALIPIVRILREKLGQDPRIQTIGVGMDEKGPLILVYIKGGKLPKGLIPGAFNGVRVETRSVGRVRPAIRR